MESSVEESIKQLQDKIKEFEREEDLTRKPVLLNEANILLKRVGHDIEAMNTCYTKERLERQLALVRNKLTKLEKEMMD